MSDLEGKIVVMMLDDSSLEFAAHLNLDTGALNFDRPVPGARKSIMFCVDDFQVDVYHKGDGVFALYAEGLGEIVSFYRD